MIRRTRSAACALLCTVLLGCQTKEPADAPVTEQGPEKPASARYLAPDISFSESDEADIRGQIERNWNLGEFAGSPNLSGMIVELRVHLSPDGTITKAEIVNDQPGYPDFRQVAESAIRAVMISSPLKSPAGKTFNP